MSTPKLQDIFRLQKFRYLVFRNLENRVVYDVIVRAQGWKFMSCNHCQELGQQAGWLLIDCTRVKTTIRSQVSKLTHLLTMTTIHLKFHPCRQIGVELNILETLNQGGEKPVFFKKKSSPVGIFLFYWFFFWDGGSFFFF